MLESNLLYILYFSQSKTRVVKKSDFKHKISHCRRGESNKCQKRCRILFKWPLITNETLHHFHLVIIYEWVFAASITLNFLQKKTKVLCSETYFPEQLGSISTTFYEQLFVCRSLKCKKGTDELTVFCSFGICISKNFT